MEEKKGCSVITLILSIVGIIILISIFGFKKLLMFSINTILIMMLVPIFIGFIWFIFSNKDK